MEKERVNLCDGCKTRVATRKCFICGNDLCNYCRSKSDKYINGINLKLVLDYCKRCLPILDKLTKDKEDEIFSQVKEVLTNNLKKRLVLEKLK